MSSNHLPLDLHFQPTLARVVPLNYPKSIVNLQVKGNSQGSECHVNDFTDFSVLRSNLWKYSVLVGETIIWAWINFATLVLFLIASSIAGLAHLLLFEKWMNLFNGYYPYKSEDGDKTLSSVNSGTPNLHTSYYPELSQLNFANQKFDFDLAIFFAHLCALVYEDVDVIDDCLKKWDLHSEKVLYEGCTVYLIYSSAPSELPTELLPGKSEENGKNSLFIVFKGTSPFNMNEWLTDAIIFKVRPSKNRLPGMAHQGFHNAIWEDQTRYKELTTKLNQLNHRLQKPNVWISGHSLGAAVATIFFGHLIYDSTWDGKLNIKGAYTFGTPRTGDHEYATELSKCLKGRPYFRIINANDVVCRVPGLFPTFDSKLDEAEKLLQDYEGLDQPRSKFVPFAGLKRALNYEHFGQPYSLNYNGTVDKNEPTFGRRIENFFHRGTEVMLGPLYYAHAKVTGKPEEYTLLRTVTNYFTPPFLADHFPSEYIAHLEKAKKLSDQ